MAIGHWRNGVVALSPDSDSILPSNAG